MRHVLDEAQDQVEISATVCTAIEAGLQSPRDIASWIAGLVARVPRIVVALADAGVRLPPGISALLPR